MNKWAVYYKNRRIFWLTLASIIPILFIGDYFKITNYLFIGWGLFVFIPISINYIMTDCPNCGNSICYKGYASPLSNRCLHCGTKVGDSIMEEKQ